MGLLDKPHVNLKGSDVMLCVFIMELMLVLYFVSLWLALSSPQNELGGGE